MIAPPSCLRHCCLFGYFHRRRAASSSYARYDGAGPPMAAAPATQSGARGSVGGEPRRVLGTLGVVMMSFFLTAAGPYGLEPAVQTAGPMLVLVATVVMPFVWAVPIGVLTAEMSSMLDENGGYVLWIQEAFGDMWGWVNGYNSLFSNCIDLPVYIVLTTDYINIFLSSQGKELLGPYTTFGMQFGAVLFVAFFNAKGLSVVEKVSIVMAYVVTAPFLLMLCMVIAQGRFTVTPSLAPPPEQIDWRVFANTMVWAWMGWDSLGCIAGEVKDPGRTFPLGVFITAIINAIVYMVSVIVGACLASTLAQWDAGFFVNIAEDVAPWLGLIITISAAISNVGIFQASLATTSRGLWAMAGGAPEEVPDAMVWRGLSWSPKCTNSPVASIIFLSFTTSILMNLSFQELVVYDVLFNNLTSFFEVAAFVYFRLKQPKRARPYKVPGGWIGVVLVCVPQVVTGATAIYFAGLRAWLIALGIEVLIVAGYFVRRLLRHKGWWCGTPAPASARGVDSATTPLSTAGSAGASESRATAAAGVDTSAAASTETGEDAGLVTVSTPTILRRQESMRDALLLLDWRRGRRKSMG